MKSFKVTLLDQNYFLLYSTAQNIHESCTYLPGGFVGFVGGIVGAVGITTGHKKKTQQFINQTMENIRETVQYLAISGQ